MGNLSVMQHGVVRWYNARGLFAVDELLWVAIVARLTTLMILRYTT
jgi:hypothetical protein